MTAATLTSKGRITWPKSVRERLRVVAGNRIEFIESERGFVIVPVLALWLDVSFRRAVATSLVIITITGAAALASHILEGARPDLAVTALLAGSMAAGALLGTMVGSRLPQDHLGRGFGCGADDAGR